MELCAIVANENAIVYCTPHPDRTKKRLLPRCSLILFHLDYTWARCAIQSLKTLGFLFELSACRKLRYLFWTHIVLWASRHIPQTSISTAACTEATRPFVLPLQAACTATTSRLYCRYKMLVASLQMALYWLVNHKVGTQTEVQNQFFLPIMMWNIGQLFCTYRDLRYLCTQISE